MESRWKIEEEEATTNLDTVRHNQERFKSSQRGIGRSGAFNRTLTPMSFQSEDRSIWEAQDTYITMSPLMHVKKYSEQDRVGKLLLIHGEVDENSGTHPLQSERYFAALKAFGIESRLCMLPHERHSYRARESILHMAWEQEEWLKSLE